MTGRALLNRVEFLVCEGLDSDGRALMRQCLYDPAGFHAEQEQAKTEALLEAGGEL